MNKKLSIKTDERFLRLVAFDPESKSERCELCALNQGSADCERLCRLCEPQTPQDLSGLEFGGYFEDYPPRQPFKRDRFQSRSFPRQDNRPFKPRHKFGGKSRWNDNRDGGYSRQPSRSW